MQVAFELSTSKYLSILTWTSLILSIVTINSFEANYITFMSTFVLLFIHVDRVTFSYSVNLLIVTLP